MALDWVPCNEYDTGIEVATDTQLTLGLLNNESWSTPVEVIGDIEGEDQGYKVIRIVGYFGWYNLDPTPSPSRGTVYARVWPAFQSQTIPAEPIVPGPITTELSFTAANEVGMVSNEKWWWERRRAAVSISDFRNYTEYEEVAHPFNWMADFKPNYYCPDNMVPALSIANTTDQTLFFRHRWRMLVSHK